MLIDDNADGITSWPGGWSIDNGESVERLELPTGLSDKVLDGMTTGDRLQEGDSENRIGIGQGRR